MYPIIDKEPGALVLWIWETITGVDIGDRGVVQGVSAAAVTRALEGP